MGNERKYTVFEIISMVFFVLTLFMLACKFGLFFKLELREKIFDVFYCFLTPFVFVCSISISIFYLIKSKKIKNIYELTDCSKNVVSSINLAVVSFEVFASLFGLKFSSEVIATRWLRLIIYLSIIIVSIDGLVYYFVRQKVKNETVYYKQRDVINYYIIYSMMVSIVLGIIIPNLMLHNGIMEAIRMG